MEIVEFNLLAKCVKHGRMCPISPRHDQRLRDMYWIESAGNTCCPWSSMSPTAIWLDKSTLPFVVWAYSTRFYEPDTIIEENVPQFQKEVLHNILNVLSANALKDVYTRSYHQQAIDICDPGSAMVITSRKYDHHGEVFSPTLLGVPSERWRQYNVFNLWPFVQGKFGVPFDALFYRQLKCNASIDFQLESEHLRTYEVNEVADSVRNEISVDEAMEWDGDLGALCEGSYHRLDSLWALATKSELCNYDREFVEPVPPIALVNVTQSESFKTVKTDVVPALLRRTVLYDLRREKLILAAEHWLAQGFPHPLLLEGKGIREVNDFLFPASLLMLDKESELQPLSVAAQRSLTGNAMHWCAIGCWFL